MALSLDPQYRCNFVATGRTSRRRKKEKALLEIAKKRLIEYDSREIADAEEPKCLSARESSEFQRNSIRDTLQRLEIQVKKVSDALERNFVGRNLGTAEDRKTEKPNKNISELEKESSMENGLPELGSGDLTHRAYVIDYSEGSSAKPQLEKPVVTNDEVQEGRRDFQSAGDSEVFAKTSLSSALCGSRRLS